MSEKKFDLSQLDKVQDENQLLLKIKHINEVSLIIGLQKQENFLEMSNWIKDIITDADDVKNSSF